METLSQTNSTIDYPKKPDKMHTHTQIHTTERVLGCTILLQGRVRYVYTYI